MIVTSAAGYDDPTVKYPRSERTPEGAEIKRVPASSLGKSSIPRRILASVAFMLQSLWIGLRTPRLAGVLFSTSPPLIGLVGVLLGALRRVPVAYWVMDLNPDQLIALGKLAPGGVVARGLARCNRLIFRRSALVVALDSAMAARLAVTDPSRPAVRVIPPWSAKQGLAPANGQLNAFRVEHQLGNATVVMYSGNHTPSNPLDTLLLASRSFRDNRAIKFIFVGGGAGKAEVEAFIEQTAPPNVLSLPYQPESTLAVSLSAADVHVVSLGDGMAGVIHPSKIYAAMAAGRPILYFGPRPSHVTELLDRYDIGWRIAHGDIDGAIAVLDQILVLPHEQRAQMGERARAALYRDLAPDRLCEQFCDAVQRGLEITDD